MRGLQAGQAIVLHPPVTLTDVARVVERTLLTPRDSEHRGDIEFLLDSRP